MPTRRKRVLPSWTFTIGALASTAGLVGLIAFALYDSVSSAKASEQQVQTTTLNAELSNFLLATREPDGSSLLDNPRDFSQAERAAGFVQMRRSFYSYLLNRGNARQLTAEKIFWDPPRPCILEFPFPERSSKLGDPAVLQVCFAVVPSESGSRYAYFTLRYPVQTIKRHRPGADLTTADRVILTFDSERPLAIVLVYEPPTLATSRYPSQLERFSGIHEMSAFLASAPERSLRYVNAQAFERPDDGEHRRNYVTIVGRIDASLVDPQTSTSKLWPTEAFSKIKVGVEVVSGALADEKVKIPPGVKGKAIVSLQNAYLSSVPSKSLLQIARTQGMSREMIWSSSDLELQATPRRTDWRQQISDWWAPKLMSMFRYMPETARITMPYRVSGPDGLLSATLSAPQVLLPGFATRAFGWLTAALILAFLLMGLSAYAIYRLRLVTQLAWAMTSNKLTLSEGTKFGKHRDELSTLSRVLISLYHRRRSHRIIYERRSRQEAIEKAKEMKLLQTRLELRQERLDAISHEIRSPLASLLVRTVADEKTQAVLKRIQNAVEAIFDARSVEDGIKNQKVVCGPLDIAEYLSRWARNVNEVELSLSYFGPDHEVNCLLDEFLFENVVNHLLDNAQRYRARNSLIEIRLSVDEELKDAVVEIFNEGRQIPEEALKSVFFYKNTDRSLPQNRGIGLFAAKAYLFTMDSTISVENRQNGVAFIMHIPLL